jgi:hypothetical protein
VACWGLCDCRLASEPPALAPGRVISTQLGTNTYFVTEVLKLYVPCGYHARFYGK